MRVFKYMLDKAKETQKELCPQIYEQDVEKHQEATLSKNERKHKKNSNSKTKTKSKKEYKSLAQMLNSDEDKSTHSDSCSSNYNDVTCPRGHIMVSKTGGSHTCNICFYPIQTSFKFLRCRECDYDLCGACTEPSLKIKKANSDCSSSPIQQISFETLSSSSNHDAYDKIDDLSNCQKISSTSSVEEEKNNFSL